MRLAAKTDENHQEVVTRLRYYGYAVWSTAAIGKGFPDLIVSNAHEMWLVEIKDGSASMTPDQKDFVAAWRGKPVKIIRSLKDVEYFHLENQRRRHAPTRCI